MSYSALGPGVVLHSPNRDYTIIDVLGQGGFGITYLVEASFKLDNITFKGRFAIKEHFLQMMCSREEGSSNIHYLPSATQEVERSKKAFLAEAQRLQKLGLNHHNIVEVSEVFECNNTAYYVMEYIDGCSLSQYVKGCGGKIDFELTTRLMRPICEAVATLHQNNMAHYDIKPQNIMVSGSGDDLRPVLIDFGLAKHYDGQGQATSSLAAAGFTPGYAPMEQYQGLTTFSPATDVYALAATTCYCLTGHAPAKAAELDLDELCDELLSNGLDDTIANVLLQSLELRAADRPIDAGSFAASLFDGAPLQTSRRKRRISTGPISQPNSQSNSQPNSQPNSQGNSQPNSQPNSQGNTITPSNSRDQAVAEGATVAPAPHKPTKQPWLIPAIVAGAVIIAAILFFVIPGGGDDVVEPVDTTRVEPIDTVYVPDNAGPETIYVEQPVTPNNPTPANNLGKQEPAPATNNNSDKQQAQPAANDNPGKTEPVISPSKPDPQPQPHSNPTPTTQPQNDPEPQPTQQDQLPARMRTSAQNLDLQVVVDKKVYYFSQNEWSALNSAQRSKCQKRGIVIKNNGQSFLLSMTLSQHTSGITYQHPNAYSFTFNEAKSFASSVKGWNLPTYEQAKAMAGQYRAICAAINAFGGSAASQWIWTRNEYDSSSAHSCNLASGNIQLAKKTSGICVRLVLPL